MFSVVQVSHCCRCSSAVYFWPEPPSRPGFSTTPSGSGCAAGSEAPSNVTHTRTDTHLVNTGVSQLPTTHIIYIGCEMLKRKETTFLSSLLIANKIINFSYKLWSKCCFKGRLNTQLYLTACAVYWFKSVFLQTLLCPSGQGYITLMRIHIWTQKKLIG